MDIDALMAVMPLDNEPEPIVHDEEQIEDDDIVLRSNEDPPAHGGLCSGQGTIEYMMGSARARE